MSKILVVDAEALFRNVFRRALESAGFEVSEANNDQDALRIAEEQFFDAVLASDTPEALGEVLAAQLRSKLNNSDLPFVLVHRRPIQSPTNLRTGESRVNYHCPDPDPAVDLLRARLGN